MEYITLHNGLKMPLLGYGVYQVSKEDCVSCVENAIKAGYRLIDTAQAYRNEEEVGEGIIRSGVPRSEIFLTSKVWISNYGYEKCKASVLESLRKMKTDYIDLMLLHQPFGDYYGAYRALVDLYKEGKIKAFGVSNFYPDRLVDLALFAEMPPMVNQIETNPLHQRDVDKMWMDKYHVVHEAWAPFGEGKNNMFANPEIAKIGKKHGKSNAQVILRWLIQRGVVALAKTVHVERMKENFDVFDFELDAEDMAAMKALETGNTLFMDHETPESSEMFHGWLGLAD